MSISTATKQTKYPHANAHAHAIALGIEFVQTPDSRHWAWLNLCHCTVGVQCLWVDSATLQAPQHVSHEVSCNLYNAMRPYFAQDGLQLHPIPGESTRWLVCGDALNVATVLLKNHIGEHLDATTQPNSSVLRRLQNEMQMLLYTNPANASTLNWVNSIWFDGTGTANAGTVKVSAKKIGLSIVLLFLFAITVTVALVFFVI